jgi:nucleoid DNA-binding protein
MCRTTVEWRSTSKQSYEDFCKLHSSIKLTIDAWKEIIYTFNESFRDYILETGEKAKLPYGFGDIAISKRKRKRTKIIHGEEFINLPIDWKKTREKGKTIYNFNYHTDGYFFGWVWFKKTSRIKNSTLWYFKPTRASSRLLAHYINVNSTYQQIYKEWFV